MIKLTHSSDERWTTGTIVTWEHPRNHVSRIFPLAKSIPLIKGDMHKCLEILALIVLIEVLCFSSTFKKNWLYYIMTSFSDLPVGDMLCFGRK